MKKNKNRFLKSNRYLAGLLEEGENFYVGIPFDNYVKCVRDNNYRMPHIYDENMSFVPIVIGANTKANIKGRYVRKQPEEKEIRTVHINYHRKDGTHVEFDRDFNAYKKILKNKYESKLHFDTNLHEEKLILSPQLLYDGSDEMEEINTHIINVYLELFSDFEIYTVDLDPAIGFNRTFDFEILPKGIFANEDIDDIVEKMTNIGRGEEARALQKRLTVIREYEPDLRGRGKDGFFGYVVFGFERKGYVVLESMYLGKATYVFDYNGYEDIIAKDKQDIIQNRLYKKRIFHYENWEDKIRLFLAQ